MTDTITLIGTVATAPRGVTTNSGLSITSFRLASTHRRFDRTENKWIDGDTNWYTVSTFRALAANTLASVKLGERVVVTGRLKIRPWQSGEKSGTAIEVEADALGHDLTWGSAKYSKGTAVPPPRDDDAPPADVEASEELLSVSAVAPDSVPASWGVAPLGSDDSVPF